MRRLVDVDLYIGKKRFGIAWLVALFVAAVVILCAAVLIFIPSDSIYTVSGCADMIKNERYIIHAGGNVSYEGETLTYTNSLEALHNCYESGNRIAEFDLMETADERVICAHDEEQEDSWAHGINVPGREGEPLSFYEFMGARFDGKLTTMCLDDLCSFMREHPDFYVVTDVKDDNERICSVIADTYPDLRNNFIIQIYHADEYARIRELGFPYMIYTLYRATDTELDPAALGRFAKEANLVGITFWMEYPESFADGFNALKASGKKLFVHTVNDPGQMKYFTDMGIDGIYTDITDKNARY